MSTTMNFETAAKQVKQAARIAAYDKGAAFTYADVAAMCVSGLSPKFICEQAELAGFPCWTSAPDEVW